MNKLKLSSRLSAIAALVDKGSRTADIGTDHGYIPVYLRQNEICPYVIASDINKGPLMSAVRSAQDYCVDNIDFVCAPGLDGVKPGDVNTVIIAGMGGETIAEILAGAAWIENSDVKLILQPQSKSEVLSAYLHTHGMIITKAQLVHDSGKLYIILACEKGKSECESFYFIDELKKCGDRLLPEYLSGLITKFEYRKKGLEASAKRDENELDNVNDTISRLRRYLEECE